MPAGFGPLAFLSIQHTPPGAQPEAFTNEERIQAFRQALPMPAASVRPWRWRRDAAASNEG